MVSAPTGRRYDAFGVGGIGSSSRRFHPFSGMRTGPCLGIFETNWTEEWIVIDTLFWWTGLVAWVLVVFGMVLTLMVDAHDRSVRRRFNRR